MKFNPHGPEGRLGRTYTHQQRRRIMLRFMAAFALFIIAFACPPLLLVIVPAIFVSIRRARVLRRRELARRLPLAERRAMYERAAELQRLADMMGPR